MFHAFSHQPLFQEPPPVRYTHKTLCQILTAQAEDAEKNRQAAEQLLLRKRGDTVALRGLIEFSNRCTADCFYCGIRRSNRALRTEIRTR